MPRFRHSHHHTPAVRYYAHGLYSYLDHHPVYLMAAGIAFNVLLCIVPLLFLLTYGLGRIIDWQRVLELVDGQLQALVPNAGYRATLVGVIRSQADAIVQNSGIVGAVGVVGAVWTSTALFSSVRTAVNGVYGFRPMRFFALYKLYDTLLLLAMGVLAVLLASAPASALAVEHLHAVLTPGFAWWIDRLAPQAVALASALVLFFVTYRFLSHRPVPARSALLGAVAATLLWELARRAFALYLARFPSLGLLYGAYTFLVVSALWLYYSALVLIVGGILVRLHWERHDRHPVA